MITGSAGNIGSALTDKLQRDYTVVGMDRSEAECDIPMDLTSPDSLKLAFRDLHQRHGKRIAAVIHLAAYFDFTGVKSPLYDEVNVKGTRHLLECLRDFDVERFVYSGTMLVHQPVDPGEVVTEESPIAPKWAYPESKAETEQVIRAHAGNMPWTLLHLAGLYDESSAVPTLTHQMARIYERDMKSHLYSGNIDAGQAFIHLEDMVEVFKRTVDRRSDLPRQHTLLAGEQDVLSYRELQDRLGRLIHGEERWRTWTLPEPIAKAGAWVQEKSEPLVPDALDHGEKPFIRPFLIDLASDHYHLDISEARHWLDWEPKHFIGDELPALVESLKRDPAGWYERNGIRPPDWLQEADEKTRRPESLRQRYEQYYREEHARNLWGPMFSIGLGAWLMASFPRLAYESPWLPWSDLVAGAAIVVLGLLSLSWRLPAARWATAAVGLWVMSAPLIFWAPTSAAYLNDTLVGALVVALSVAIRPAPGVSPVAEMTGPIAPPGWRFTPSSWFQRLPIVILAFIGFFISSYMAAYQLGHIDGVWEPFFAGARPDDAKNGTEEIITSRVSEAWPVPDAGLGALVYLLEILLGVTGSTRRWRTMPWLVTLFGIMIVPMGAVSITFIIIQPILLDTWCTLCLITAATMLIQIPYALDELVATGMFLRRRQRQGHPLLRVFLFGDTDEGQAREQDRDDFQRSPLAIVRKMASDGVSLPWGLAVCIGVGVWLMFTRLTLGVDGGMADAHHMIGSLLIAVSAMAMAETGRALRFVNLFLALALLVVPFILSGDTMSLLSTVAAAVVVAAASIPRGPVTASYGSWDRVIV